MYNVEENYGRGWERNMHFEFKSMKDAIEGFARYVVKLHGAGVTAGTVRLRIGNATMADVDMSLL